MKLNLGSGAHPLDGFVNLDKEDGWTFEDGLGQYADGSVEGITESHGLMYVEVGNWPFVFTEFARVLEPNGVLRITEDATDDPRGERYGGFRGAVTLTTAGLVWDHIKLAGLDPSEALHPAQTFFKDLTLIQTWHGSPPKVFHIEGLKPQ